MFRKKDRLENIGSNIYLMVLIIIATVFFLHSIRSILSPFVIFLFLFVLIFPLRKNPVVIKLTFALTLLFFIWFFQTTAALLSPFILSLVLAYLFDPLIDRFEERRVPRSLAIFILIVPVVVGIFFLLYAFIPKLIKDGTSLIEAVPGVIDKVQVWLQETLKNYGNFQTDFVDDLRKFIRGHGIDLLKKLGEGAVGVGKGIGAVITFVAYIVLTPVITFYLLRDIDRLKAKIAEILPLSKKEGVVNFAVEYDSILGSYLRGQLIVSSLVGLMSGIGFFLWGFVDDIFFRFAILLGVITGVFSIVPYIGVVVSIIPAVIIALLSQSVGYSLLGVAIVFVIVQSFEGNFISPRIIGERVGIHPVLIMLALLLCPFFFGFVGLLIAIPIAVLIKLLVIKSIESYKESELYLSKPEQKD